MRMIKTAACFFLLLMISLSCFSQYSKEKTSQKRTIRSIDSLFASKIKAGELAGVVVQIRKGEKNILSKAYGYANAFTANGQLLSDPEPLNVNYLFDLASLTKVVGTTTSIMLLQDQGKLNVDDKVGKYIPAFNSEDKKSITLRHLLTHTAGLHDWYPMYYRSNNRKDTYKLIGELPLKYPVGTGRHYSDLGFTVLGQIIEIVSGMPLEEFTDQQIFQPLGMTHTSYNPIKKGFSRFAATSHGNPYEKRMVYDSTLGYRFKEIDPDSWKGWRQYLLVGEVNDGNAWYANGGVSGAAGLFSTVADLQRLVDMLQHKGKVGNNVFIHPATIESFLTKDSSNNGLGWMMDPANSFMKGAPDGSFGHTGFTGTSIVVIPSKGLSIILLANRQNKGLSSAGEYYNMGPLRMQLFNLCMGL